MKRIPFPYWLATVTLACLAIVGFAGPTLIPVSQLKGGNSGYVVYDNGTTLARAAPGGDLSGSQPNPTVAKINGVTLGSTTATSGNLLIGSGSQWVTQAMSGDATISSGGVFTLGTSGVTASTYGDATHIPVVTVDAKGRATTITTVAISAPANAFVDYEVPTPAVDGATTAFTFAHTPSPTAAMHLYLNGQRLLAGAGNDYTISGAVVTMATAPASTDVLAGDYRY